MLLCTDTMYLSIGDPQPRFKRAFTLSLEKTGAESKYSHPRINTCDWQLSAIYVHFRLGLSATDSYNYLPHVLMRQRLDYDATQHRWVFAASQPCEIPTVLTSNLICSESRRPFSRLVPNVWRSMDQHTPRCTAKFCMEPHRVMPCRSPYR